MSEWEAARQDLGRVVEFVTRLGGVVVGGNGWIVGSIAGVLVCCVLVVYLYCL